MVNEELMLNDRIKELYKKVSKKEMTWIQAAEIVNAEYGTELTANAIQKRNARLQELDGEITITPSTGNETIRFSDGSIQETKKSCQTSLSGKSNEDIVKELGYGTSMELVWYRESEWESASKDGSQTLYARSYKVKHNTKINPLDYLQIAKEVFSKEIKPLKFAPKKANKSLDEDNLTFLQCPELHLNKKSFAEISEAYNIEIATERFRKIIIDLIEKQRVFKSGTFYMTIGNDFLNSDTPNNTTTLGTQMTNDVHWRMAFRLALELISEALLTLREEFNHIDIAIEPANHDYSSSFMLFEALRMRFIKDNIISFNQDLKDTQAYDFGKTLIISNHGDKNIKRFIETIPARFRELWGKCEYVYVYSGHEHHDEMRINKNGITHHKQGTIANEDEYEGTNSFIGSLKQQQYSIFNKHCGKIAELFIIFPKEKTK